MFRNEDFALYTFHLDFELLLAWLVKPGFHKTLMCSGIQRWPSLWQCDCPGSGRTTEPMMRCYRCCHTHRKDVVEAGINVFLLFQIFYFLFPLIQMYSALRLHWTQLVVTQSQPCPAPKVMVGFRLRAEYLKRVFLSSLKLVTAVLLVPALQAPRRWAVLCEAGLGCVWEGGVFGKPESPLCLGSSLPTETRPETALPVPLEGSAAWGKGRMLEGVACGSLGCCSPLASVSFSATIGSSFSPVPFSSHTPSSHSRLPQKLPVTETHSWVAGQERNNSSCLF